MDECNYVLNGLPVYIVEFIDFSYFVGVFNSGNRFLTRSIKDERIINHIKRYRNSSRNFYIEYAGILLDIRNL